MNNEARAALMAMSDDDLAEFLWARGLRAVPFEDDASEYGRLLAERDRLIASGVDPADLEMPLPPAAP